MANFKGNYSKKNATMSTVMFRADSSSIMGTGHIMRDLVLAEQYSDAKIVFATQELAGNINHKIKEAGYNLEILKSNDFQELDHLVKKLKINVMVIDHYEIDYEFEKRLKLENQKLKILSFDGSYKKHYCDILLNHNIYAEAKRYKDLVPKECELRCGSEYTLLRDEFYKEKEREREKKYDILVVIGGADTLNLNIKILALLPNTLKVVVVTTTANKYLSELQDYVSETKIILHINSSKIAKLMNESKFAIITPSVTANEAYFMELDFIAIKTAKNQEEMYQFLKSKGYLVLEKFEKEKFEVALKKSNIK
ncbi:MAG TPA: UDP-2,4-diacetamido-2,4,6-trideoxy-beta-L-altropyranose hydrolase [Arcobacter sp.]|nr:UDP-2,4-diacetamido-2,4,6-trideoxy-beta-L-altropyranose hydrolase [Arcobacter sp.]